MTPRPPLSRLSRLARFFSQLRHYHIEHKGLKLLALLIAFFLFFVSRQPLSDVRLTGVSLEFRGLSPGLEISGDVSQTVSVRLRGPQDVMRNIMPNQIAVIADLTNKELGERVVQLKPSDVSRPDNVEVRQIEPPSIKLTIEQTLSRQVAIKPSFIGKVAEGFEVYSVTAEPSTIEIAGPQSHVSKIENAPTESIKLNGQKASFTATVDADIPDHAIRVTTPGQIKISVEIGPRRSETTSDETRTKQ